MKKIKSTWGQVRQKHAVVELKGIAYSVEDEKAGWLRLQRVHDLHWMPGVRRPPDDAAVTMLEPTHKEAVRLVAERLNGEYLAHQTPGHVWLVPVLPTEDSMPVRAEYRRHLWIGHGWANHDRNLIPLAELIEIHDASHAAPDLKIVKPHRHGSLTAELERTE